MGQAIGYIRVSTEEQTAGVSLEAQDAKIHAWCLATDTELVAVYRDEGISGSKGVEDRPGLQAAMAHACRIHGSLMVYSLSRLARNTKETLTLAESLHTHHADLVSLSEKIDTTSAAGKMVFRMLAVLAEFERDQVIERTKMAMAYKRANGQRISRHIPYGFRLAADGKSLEPDAAEQSIMQAVRELAEGGMGLRAIARELAAAGHYSRTGNVFTTKTLIAILTRAA